MPNGLKLNRALVGVEPGTSTADVVAFSGWPTTLEELAKLGDAGRISRRLIRDLKGANHRQGSAEDRREFAGFARRQGFNREGWAYPEYWFYGDVLANINSTDVVLEIGAGNLALSIALAARASRVYAVEANPLVMASGVTRIGLGLPRNLIPVSANASDFPIPPDVTTIVCLVVRLDQRGFPEWNGRRVIHSIHVPGVGGSGGSLKEILNFPDGPTRFIVERNDRRTSFAEIRHRRAEYDRMRKAGGIKRTIANAGEGQEPAEYWEALQVPRPTDSH